MIFTCLILISNLSSRIPACILSRDVARVLLFGEALLKLLLSNSITLANTALDCLCKDVHFILHVFIPTPFILFQCLQNQRQRRELIVRSLHMLPTCDIPVGPQREVLLDLS